MSRDENFFNFLEEEYNYYSNSFHKNEENGDKILNFFITISTAILGGIIVLITNYDHLLDLSDYITYFIAVALAVLITFGLLTLLRMLKRNENSDKYKIAMDKIRRAFSKELDPNETKYQLYHKKLAPRKVLTGGMVDITAALNSIFISLTIAVIFGFFSPVSWAIILVFFIALVLVFCLLLFFVKRKYNKSYIKLTKMEESEAIPSDVAN